MDIIKNYFSYYRRKRLKLLLTQNSETNLSRHWFIRFVITSIFSILMIVFFILVVESIFPNNVNARYSLVFLPILLLLAVDLSDWLWGKIFDEVTAIINVVIKFGIISFIALSIVLLNPWDILGLRKKISDWHYKTNVSMQNQNLKNQFKLIGANSGLNWFAFTNENGFLEPLPFDQAKSHCENIGGEFIIPSKDQFLKLDPKPQINKKLSFWVSENLLYVFEDLNLEGNLIAPTSKTQSSFLICIRGNNQ